MLRPDLQYVVEEDNEAFRQEIAEYDARKERERLREVSQGRPAMQSERDILTLLLGTE